MKLHKAMGLVMASAIAVSLSGAAAAEEKYSGFLGDYSKLAEQKDAAGETVMRYVSPAMKPGAYQKLMVDAVQFYPAPMASEEVSDRTLNDIRNYVDKGLHDKLAAKGLLATEPGPGVLRVRPAITAVASQGEGLKPYEVLPIGFLISQAKGRGREATIQIEIEVLDSVTGERVSASLRKGVGAKLERSDAKLKLSDLTPLLDKWIDAGTAFAAERLK